MLRSDPQVGFSLKEVLPTEMRSPYDSELVSQSKRSLGFDLDAAGPVKPIASAVVFTAVA